MVWDGTAMTVALLDNDRQRIRGKSFSLAVYLTIVQHQWECLVGSLNYTVDFIILVICFTINSP